MVGWMHYDAIWKFGFGRWCLTWTKWSSVR